MRMPPFSSRYEPLSTNEDVVPPHQVSQPRWIHGVCSIFPTSGAPHRQGWNFFVAACLVSFVVSAVNITLVSLSTSFHALPKPQITPSVYIGLENLPRNTVRCRSRMTFPRSFYTFRDDKIHAKTLVHAPDDRTTLNFGGRTSALIDFYVPDYGLENCTFTAKFLDDMIQRHLEIYMLQGPDNIQDRESFGTLTLGPSHKENTTDVFHCPSRTHIFLQLRCPSSDCRIQFPLEGVTSMTASAESLGKTGFRIVQYEALGCPHH
ncbi:hypothetical protein DFH07DRAFT_791287 [Mycena maculata]|uniref:Ubiquitin 3 binding protein But2 C-terminal domain-containing protein n=1 Tax=Mycena maculata TaxID=230809 RepID=A0AAD7KAR8_9AGAR|nr:hypothetical protein DFH07DRAFT_791287 [Mycena maculata]